MADTPPRGEPTEVEAPDEGVELLTSPVDRAVIHRVFVIGGPLGLAVALVLGVWVAFQYVRHTAIVQVEPVWAVGGPLALRAQIVPEQPAPVLGATGTIWVEQSGARVELGELTAVDDLGVLQAAFDVPAGLTPGSAVLGVRMEAQGVEPIEERVPVEIAAAIPDRDGTYTVASSTLQYGDDTEPQPQAFRIDLRPSGRLLAGFDNTLFVRVVHPDGRPAQGEVEIRLVDGEFMGGTQAKLLARKPLDALGLAVLQGSLGSEVLRIAVDYRDAAGNPRANRRFRLVSYPGAVRVDVTPLGVPRGQPVEWHSYGLRRTRPVFVDVHGPGGAWVDTAIPPFSGAEPPRAWAWRGEHNGILQFEAYHFTNVPGESTAIARVQVIDDPTSPASLDPLLAAQRAELPRPRVEKGFDAKLETAYLAAIDAATLQPAEVETARAYLLGTLPVMVFGPPTAIATRDRDIEALQQWQARWRLGLRIFLLGGGGLFLLAMTIVMARAHGRVADSTIAWMDQASDGEAQPDIAQHVRRARREALARGLLMIAIMAGGLVMTVAILESLIWIG